MTDRQKPTALFIGRFQPFHMGHKRLIEEGLKRVGQVCIAVRDTHGIDEKNPFSFESVKARIQMEMAEQIGRIIIISIPNITNVFYGRDVGYSIEKITLDQETENISASKIRAERGPEISK